MEEKMTNPEIKESKAIQDLATDLAALREDFSKLSSSMRDVFQTQATSTTRRVLGAVDDSRQKLSDEISVAKDQFGTMTAEIEKTIERSPLAAVLVGAAVGFVIGLVSRSHK